MNASKWRKWQDIRKLNKNGGKMGKGFKQGRLGGEIQKIVSQMIIKDLKDPRIEGLISVTDVEVSGDGSYATIFLTCFSTPEEKEKKEKDLLEALEHSKGVIKKEIAHKVKVRHIPELRFKIDKSFETGSHIDELISKINSEK